MNGEGNHFTIQLTQALWVVKMSHPSGTSTQGWTGKSGIPAVQALTTVHSFIFNTDIGLPNQSLNVTSPSPSLCGRSGEKVKENNKKKLKTTNMLAIEAAAPP